MKLIVKHSAGAQLALAKDKTVTYQLLPGSTSTESSVNVCKLGAIGLVFFSFIKDFYFYI